MDLLEGYRAQISNIAYIEIEEVKVSHLTGLTLTSLVVRIWCLAASIILVMCVLVNGFNTESLTDQMIPAVLT